jgi:hypothetical protein
MLETEGLFQQLWRMWLTKQLSQMNLHAAPDFGISCSIDRLMICPVVSTYRYISILISEHQAGGCSVEDYVY